MKTIDKSKSQIDFKHPHTENVKTLFSKKTVILIILSLVLLGLGIWLSYTKIFKDIGIGEFKTAFIGKNSTLLLIPMIVLVFFRSLSYTMVL